MAKATDSNCPVTRGEMDLDFYAQRDGVWRELGLAAPARRALVNADLLTIKSLTTITRDEIAKLHGMGPSALNILDRTLARAKISFLNK